MYKSTAAVAVLFVVKRKYLPIWIKQKFCCSAFSPSFPKNLQKNIPTFYIIIIDKK